MNTEIEIRGKLTKEEYQRLEEFLKKEGSFIESHDREMILLHGYPGFSTNPIERHTDIRLRKTNGKAELMVKRFIDGDFETRSEISLMPTDNNWDNLKEVVRAFGVTKGTLMHRLKEMYIYHDIEWSLVTAGEGIYYYEAELLPDSEKTSREAKEYLYNEAKMLGLSILDENLTKEFLEMLNVTVNKEIDL